MTIASTSFFQLRPSTSQYRFFNISQTGYSTLTSAPPTIGLGGFIPRPTTMQIQRPLARLVIGNVAAIVWIPFLGEIPVAVADGDHLARLLNRALLLWTISSITPKHPQTGLRYRRLRA